MATPTTIAITVPFGNAIIVSPPLTYSWYPDVALLVALPVGDPVLVAVNNVVGAAAPPLFCTVQSSATPWPSRKDRRSEFCAMVLVEHAARASTSTEARAWMHAAVHGFVGTKSEGWQDAMLLV
jgi:hypothetical protein